MAFWVFRCNTDWFDLDGKLADLDKAGSWKVNRHKKDIHSGDVAFIWQTQKRGNFGGIRATCSVVSEPREMGDAPSDIPFARGDGEPGVELQVSISYTDSDVRLEEAKIKQVVPNLSLFKRPWDGTNFDVDPKDAETIMKMIADSKSGMTASR